MHYHKEDRENFIRYLAERFPRCFFEDPAQRRPLKRNIAVDLEKQNVLDQEKLSQTLDWYMSHFAYRYSLMAGADRIDLDGNKAGTVTPQEQMEARKWIAARKHEMNERQIQHVTPTTKPVVVIKPATNGLHPSLTELQAVITIVSNILTEKQYEPMRPALAAAALQGVIDNAERLIHALQNKGEQAAGAGNGLFGVCPD
jgi:hypothetical protein